MSSSKPYVFPQFLRDTGMVKELKELLQRYPYGLQCCDIVKMLAARGIDVQAADLNPLLYHAPFEQVGAARPPFFTFREPAQNQRTYAYFRCDETPCAAVSATAKAVRDEHAKDQTFTRSDVSTPAAPDPYAIIAHGQSAPAASDPYVSLQIRDRNAMCMLNTYFQKTTRTNSAFSFGTSSSAPFACALEFAVDGENIKRTVRVYGFPKKSMAHDMAAQRALNIIDAVRMRRHAAACYETAVAQRADMLAEFALWYNSYTTMRGERFKEAKSDVEFCDGRYSVTLHYEMLRITYDGNDAVRSRRAQGVWDGDKEAALNKVVQLAFEDIAGIQQPMVGKKLCAPTPCTAPKRCRSALDFEHDDDDSSDSDDETLMPSIAELATVERAARETLKRNLTTLICNDDEPCPELVSATDHRGVVVPRTAEHARLLERERAVSLSEKFVAVARTEDARTVTKAPERRVPPLASFRLTKKESRDALDEYYSALSGKAGWNISTTDGNGLRGCDITFDVEADLARYTMSVSGFELWHDAVTSAVELALDVIDAMRMQQHAGVSYDACVAKGAGVSMFDEFSKWYTGYCTMRGEEFSGMKLDQWNENSLLLFTMTCKALYVDVAGNRVIRSLRSMHAICTEPKQAMDLVAKRMWLHIAGRQYTENIIEEPTQTANVSNIPLDCRELTANECHVEKRTTEAIPLPKRRVPPPASFRLTATDPREALDEYYHAMADKTGWSFSTVYREKEGFGVDAEFDVENELVTRQVSVKGFSCYKEAMDAAIKTVFDVIGAIRMQKHAAECYDAYVSKKNVSWFVVLSEWYGNYCTMRGERFSNALISKWNPTTRCSTLHFFVLCIAPDGNSVTRESRCMQSGRVESNNYICEQALLLIAGRHYDRDVEQTLMLAAGHPHDVVVDTPKLPVLSPLSDAPKASDDEAQPAKQTVGCIACSVFDPPKDRQCDVCVTINDMHLHADKSKRHELCRDTVFTPSFPVGCVENNENDKPVDNNVVQVANRTDAIRNFIVFHFAYQPTAALNAYQHALTGTGPEQTTVENADHRFTYTLSFNVEGELAKRIVNVRGYSCTHKMAQNDAATRALNIIDAVRMRLDATECLAKCAEDEPTTRKIPCQWFTSYHTMRSYSPMPWAVEKRGITLHSEVGTSIMFTYWRVDDDGDNASLVERHVTGLGKTSDDSLADAMRQAVVIIAFGDQKKSDANDAPVAAAPKEFESTASNVQRLYTLCCALDPVKDSKLRPSYSAFASEIAGKTAVNAMVPAPDGGVTYRSPHIIIGEVCDEVFEAKEMAAHYVLCWIGARIFGIACSQQIEDTTKK